MKVIVRVDDAATLEALKAARRATNQGVKEGLRRGAERHGLPRARSLAPGGRIPAALRAGATTRSAYIQLDVRKAPHGPLLEFGGVRRDIIEPRAGAAVLTPAGPRRRVTGPRRYRAQGYMSRAVTQTLPRVLEEAQEAIVELFEARGLRVS